LKLRLQAEAAKQVKEERGSLLKWRVAEQKRQRSHRVNEEPQPHT
jgi:hypothetical protein